MQVVKPTGRLILPWTLASALLVAIVFLQNLDRDNRVSAPAQSSDSDERSERVQFESGTVEPGGLDADDPDISAQTISGILSFPGGDGPFPAAVFIHGSLGLSSVQYDYAKLLNQSGYAVLMVDSFSMRGRSDVVGDQLAINTPTMTVDAYAALDLLARHPSIMSDTIMLVGWSKGGAVAQLAMNRRYADILSSAERGFKAHVAFYPWCGEQDADLELSNAPILFVLAGRDDWVDPQSCKDYAERLRAADYAVHITEYPDAEHGFDYPFAYRRYLASAKSWGDCHYFVRAEGFVVAQSGRFRPWHDLAEYFSKCTHPGAHIGSNAIARSAARTLLLDFLEKARNNGTAEPQS